MNKNKSINELLGSIVSLINEAKNEYEFVINKNLPKNIYPEIEKIEKESTLKVKKNSDTISQVKIDSFEEKKVKRFNNWKNINFEKTIKKSYLKSFSSNLSRPNNEKIEDEFRSLLNSWLKRNLNRLIEQEISNYIKNRKN
tara:strand:+ start:351 stop:773 length:423 start_codon:yes stop_codon:yes gene_type:complete